MIRHDALLQVTGLTKSFGPQPVLRGLDLTLSRGQALAIFGPNGVGKTTLLRILGLLTRPNDGDLRLDGAAMFNMPHQARRRIGLVTHQSWLFQDLTAQENLRFYAELYGLDGLAVHVDRALEQVDLSLARHRTVRLLSHGTQRRLAIARAILHEPDLLLLDEPYAGLDPQAAQRLDGIITDWLARNRAVILTSHNLSQSLAHCTHWAVLRQGQLAAQGPRTAWQGAEVYWQLVEKAAA